jgi:hypothetical protein
MGREAVRYRCQPRVRHRSFGAGGGWRCGRNSMVEFQPSKLAMRVRFPSPAPVICFFSIYCSPGRRCRPPVGRMVLPEISILFKTDFRTQLCQSGRLAGNLVFYPNRRSLRADNESSIPPPTAPSLADGPLEAIMGPRRLECRHDLRKRVGADSELMIRLECRPSRRGGSAPLPGRKLTRWPGAPGL